MTKNIILLVLYETEEIQNFLYEIDNDYNLTDDQVNALAKQIFDNQKKLFSLFDKVVAFVDFNNNDC